MRILVVLVLMVLAGTAWAVFSLQNRLVDARARLKPGDDPTTVQLRESGWRD